MLTVIEVMNGATQSVQNSVSTELLMEKPNLFFSLSNSFLLFFTKPFTIYKITWIPAREELGRGRVPTSSSLDTALLFNL